MKYDKQVDFEDTERSRMSDVTEGDTAKDGKVSDEMERATNATSDDGSTTPSSLSGKRSRLAALELTVPDKAEKGEEASALINFEGANRQAPITHAVGLWWCVAQGLTRGAMYAGQKVAHDLTSAQLSHIVLIRSVMVVLGAYVYGKRDGVDFSIQRFRDLPGHMQKSVFVRSLYGFAAVLCAMIAVHLTPVSVAVSIMMTQVFASALAGYALGNESLSAFETMSMVGGFAGVLLLTNDSLFGSDDPRAELRNILDRKQHPHFSLGIFMAVLYTVFSALNFYEMRRMGNGVHSSVKTFYFGVVCTGLTVVYLAAAEPSFFCIWNIGTDAHPLTAAALFASAAIGAFSWANQESLSLALTVVKQGTASAFNNVALIVSFLTDAWFFGRSVFPQDLAATAMIIFFSVLQCLLANRYAKKEILKE